MAARDQRKAQAARAGDANREKSGADAGFTSRVSKAMGAIGSEKVRVEQRAGTSASDVKPRSMPKASASKNAATARRVQGQQPGGKKSPRSARRPTPGASSSPSPQTVDSRIIGKAHDKWRSMPPHHQQRVYSILLLALSVLLLGALTFWHTVPLLKQTGTFFLLFFGWGAYPLAFGLILFALFHLVEGMRNARFVRWSVAIGLLAMMLLLLAESALLDKGTGGVIGGLLSGPLLGWPAQVQQVVVIGLLTLAAILTFRIKLSHIGSIFGLFKRLFADPQRASARDGAGYQSPFLGQRPKFSRYTGSTDDSDEVSQPDARDGGRGVGKSVNGRARAEAIVEEDDEEDGIDFDADFDVGDDPANDINLHRKEVGSIPRGAGPAVQPLDMDEHASAVRGARQQALPFGEAGAHGQRAGSDYPQMEPLAPNPRLAKLPKILTRAAKPEVESPWKLSDSALLNNPEEVKVHVLGDDTTTLARVIQETLRSFRVEAEVKAEDISIGPTVIRFGIRPTGKPTMKTDEKGRLVPVRDAAGNIVYEQRTRVSRIMALQNDIALVLEAKSIRMEAPVPGRPYVGVEIPNKNSRLVTLREIFDSKEYAAAKAKSKLALALGKDVAGAVRVGDLARMPHMLIAGATGAGKSVCLNAFIGSFLMQATPDDVRMLMIDPKMVELNMYNGIPHLLAPVVTEVDKVVGLLKIAIAEMEKRYRLFSQLSVRNLEGYRKLRAERMAHGDNTLKNLPAIVIIIDELADLMMAAPEEVEGLICRLAQLARATGIHLIIATQRPSVDVITGLIKANIPTRISFMVSSAVDSRTIIDMGGAERLLGRGDMLYLPADAGKPERIQGAFVADDEAERLVAYWKQQAAEHAATLAAAAGQKGQGAVSAVPPAVEPGWELSEHISDEYELDDELFEQAEQVVQEYERASISLLQRRLRIGYSRAARLIDLLEERGVIGRIEPGGRAREVYDKRGGEGRTMADEAADIIAEERAKEEFLKKQAGRNGQQNEDR
ncbi:MAG TPA: DNA translocase FtsK [Ktedonobacteraceae bacterium]|nr:DNA translocase FtsK [Ktedonobacteraceae bacterium]